MNFNNDRYHNRLNRYPFPPSSNLESWNETNDNRICLIAPEEIMNHLR